MVLCSSRSPCYRPNVLSEFLPVQRMSEVPAFGRHRSVKRSLFSQILDLGRRVTQQSRHQFIGMLPQERRRRFYFARRCAHSPWNSAMPFHTDLGMLELNPVLSRGEIRIVVEILVVGTSARGDVCRLKDGDDVGYAPLQGPFSDDRLERIFIQFA